MITLIPNSGVQFITKEVNLSDDKLNKFRPFEYYEEKDEEEEDEDVFLFKLPYYLSRISSYIEKAPSESGNTVINAEAINVETWEVMDEEKILDRVIHRIPEEEIISIPARKALECFENKWLPVPYLLKTAAGDKFHDGPTAWPGCGSRRSERWIMERRGPRITWCLLLTRRKRRGNIAS